MGLPWEAGFTFATDSYEPPLYPRQVVLPPIVDGRSHPLDRIADAYFAEKHIERPHVVDDRVFLRRVSLDLVGLLPTSDQTAAFLNDPTANKRATKIRELLDSRQDYAEHWLSFYNDLLRNDYSGTGFITNGRSQVSSWLYDALLNNMPFDQFARELIAPPTPASQGYIDGIKWRGEVSAGQTLDIQFAQSISQSFLDAVWQLTGAAPEKFDAPIARASLQTGEVPSAAKDSRLVRASLLKNDAFMRSLGRPGREQIVSMRPDHLTTLEAIDLANQATLADALMKGAATLHAQLAGKTQPLAEHLYQAAFMRSPTTEELAQISLVLGDSLAVEQVADLLWSICMQPDFMLVR